MSLAYKFWYRVLLGLAALSVISLGFASLAQGAVVTHDNQRVPVAFAAYSPCATEPVPVEGTSHRIVHVTQDQSGGSHIVSHSVLIAQGVGASGDRYIFQERLHFHDKSDPDSADNFTTVTDNHIVRQGETITDDDHALRVRSHRTENANGETTATFEDVVSECR